MQVENLKMAARSVVLSSLTFKFLPASRSHVQFKRIASVFSLS